jgi:hypothetical protein
MKLPIDPSKFTSKWKYVEIARWRQDQYGEWKVLRETRNKQPLILEWDDVEEYRKRYNNVGIYTSVWNYNSDVVHQATRLGPLYFDLDSSEAYRAYEDTTRLVEYLSDFVPESGIRVYFTGKKGFHVECAPQNCDDYDENKSQSHIDDWIRRREMGIGGRPYSCQRANSAGVGCGDCHLENRERVVRVGDKWVSTGEEAAASPIRFAYYKKKD